MIAMKTAVPPTDRAEKERIAQAVARIEALATLMDGAFVIPGTGIRMGLDGIIGLVPNRGRPHLVVMSATSSGEASSSVCRAG